MIVRRIAIVGAMILSMRGYYFMEKLCIMSGLSMKRWGLGEKRGCREVGEAQSRRSEPFGVARAVCSEHPAGVSAGCGAALRYILRPWRGSC